MSEEFKTSKARAERCVTHHHACDCREYKFQELEQQLAALREAIELCERTRKYNGSGGTCKAHIDSMEALLGEQR